MAGQARRGTQDPARSSRADSSWLVLAAASAAGSGSATVTTTPASSSASTRELPTRATYRNLIIRGLAPDEAANLTAWISGIDVGDTGWTLRQVNQLLFLREMNRAGQFAEATDRLH
jgi:hypothetical protein